MIDPSASETVLMKQTQIKDTSANNANNTTTSITTISTFTKGSPTTSTSQRPPKSVKKQLAEAATAKEQRRLEMSGHTSLGANSNSVIGKVVSEIKATDNDTIRHALITLALVSSLFGALLLVLANPDPPTASSGILYTHADLMRLLVSVHDRSVELVPNSLSQRDWIEALKNGTLMEKTTEKWKELLTQWWPIKPVDHTSSDAILEDGNYYARHYKTFQGAFIVLCCSSEAILLLTWAYFLAAKELTKNQNQNGITNGHTINGHNNRQSRVKSPKLISEQFNESWEKTKNLFGGRSSSLKRLKRNWFDESPKRPWKRPLVLTIGSLLTLDLLLFTVLLIRPNFFTLLLHEVLFILLSILCLASTERSIDLQQTQTRKWSKPASDESNGSNVSLPRSLRSNGSTLNGTSRKKTNKVHNFRQTDTEPLIEEAVSGSATPIFVTEQSANQKPNNFPTSKSSPPATAQHGLNPFGSFDETEEEEEDLQVNSKIKKQNNKNQSIDEEAEKEVEQV